MDHVTYLERNTSPNKNGITTRTTYHAKCSCGWQDLCSNRSKPRARQAEVDHWPSPVSFLVYEPWRHGGWYTNVLYPSGAVGCVSANYPDKHWRIVCDDRPGSFPGGPNDHTYPSRDDAARAEFALIRQGVLG